MHPIFLSVIIPAYKEGARIGATLLCLEKYFHDKPYSYEIIVVNDGSPDNT
ncbi:MAG: glycosyltransferase, partial [Patescibacteria group bacterium]|nr:glycosyltransferase [Patescibacteria group bacterium]